ncbi:hypothetical protein GIB67_003910, partial [Kingdonia uniflora]
AMHCAISVNNLWHSKILFVYAKRVAVDRRSLWDELVFMSSLYDSPWAIVGDFNTVRSNKEKLGRRAANGMAMMEFEQMIKTAGLLEASFSGSNFLTIKLQHLDRVCSDHAPLFLSYKVESAIEYFKEVFTVEAVTIDEELLSYILEFVTADDNNLLLQSPSMQEIKDSLWSIPNDSAPVLVILNSDWEIHWIGFKLSIDGEMDYEPFFSGEKSGKKEFGSAKKKYIYKNHQLGSKHNYKSNSSVVFQFPHDIEFEILSRLSVKIQVFGPMSKQKELFDEAVSLIVNEDVEGYNCTIFAYGLMGTGKTYTRRRKESKGNGEFSSDAGVIPRAVRQFFKVLEAQNVEYNMKVTFLELYNKEIMDLLALGECVKFIDDKLKKPIALMEDGKGGIFVRGLEEEIVTTANEIYKILEKEGVELIKCGKLNLVDLAGSENISRSGAREGHSRVVETTRSSSNITVNFFKTLDLHSSKLSHIVEEAQTVHDKKLSDLKNKYEECAANEEKQLLAKVAELLASSSNRKKVMLSSAATSFLEDLDVANRNLLCCIEDSLKLDNEARGNIDSMVDPCCNDLRDLKSVHYHKIVEITENVGKCLEKEYMPEEPRVKHLIPYTFRKQRIPLGVILSVLLAASTAIEYFGIKAVLQLHTIKVLIRKAIVVRWCKPPVGFFKLNTNGSAAENLCGVGGIVRNSRGVMVFAFSATLGSGTNTTAELYALLLGLQHCQQNKWFPLLVEVNSEVVANCDCYTFCSTGPLLLLSAIICYLPFCLSMIKRERDEPDRDSRVYVIGWKSNFEYGCSVIEPVHQVLALPHGYSSPESARGATTAGLTLNRLFVKCAILSVTLHRNVLGFTQNARKLHAMAS